MTVAVQLSLLSPDEARRLTDEVKQDAERLRDKLLRLYEGEAHEALGYPSWQAYWDAEFDTHWVTGYRELNHAKVERAISQMANEIPEAQARELVPLLDDEREVVAAWREARSDAEARGVKVTAQVVRNAVRKRVERVEREQQAERRRAEPAEALVEDAFAIYPCDFRDLIDTGVDLSEGVVITDPPYPREFLKDWADMAQCGLEWGCDVLVAMCGQSILPDAIELVLRAEYLYSSESASRWEYRWCGAYLAPGPAARVWNANVGTSWKPVLVFDRGDGREFVTSDVFRSSGDDKRHHPWGQNEDGIAALVEAFTRPGDLVVDPFLGGGTTAVVCRELGRRFVGCDVDPSAIAATEARLAA